MNNDTWGVVLSYLGANVKFMLLSKYHRALHKSHNYPTLIIKDYDISIDQLNYIIQKYKYKKLIAAIHNKAYVPYNYGKRNVIIIEYNDKDAQQFTYSINSYYSDLYSTVIEYTGYIGHAFYYNGMVLYTSQHYYSPPSYDDIIICHYEPYIHSSARATVYVTSRTKVIHICGHINKLPITYQHLPGIYDNKSKCTVEVRHFKNKPMKITLKYGETVMY